MSKEIPLNEWFKDERIWKTGRNESMEFELIFKVGISDLVTEPKITTNRPYLYYYKKSRLINWRRIK